MSRVLLLVLLIAGFLLHQDQWFWRSPTPLVFGVLPPGLWYHAIYSFGCAALMWYLTRTIWPAHLERD